MVPDPLSSASLFEIPKSVRYDFLISLLGLISFSVLMQKYINEISLILLRIKRGKTFLYFSFT